MAQKIIITNEERAGMHEVLAAEYVPLNGQEGMFVFDGIATNGWAVEDVAGLRSTVETTRNERERLKSQLKSFDGVDAAEHARLLAKKSEIDNWDPTNDDAFKTRLEEQNATWQGKYDADMTAEKAKSELSGAKYAQHRLKSEGISAISKHAPKGVKVLLPHVLGQLGVYPSEDGQTDEVWVRGADGRPRITQKAGEQGNMSADELVLSMKDDEDFMSNYPGTGATGGGATGGGNGPGPVKVDNSLSPVERLKAARRAQATT
tara:strand:- start:53606 stop:54391 length:786 start_codon:yes stop_codon:yes gene_type:complete